MIKSIFYRFYALFLSANFKKIRIGRSAIVSIDTILESNVAILDYTRVFQSKIDSYSYVSPFSIIIKAEIGRYTSIGPGCKIGLGLHPIDGASTSPYLYNDNLFKKKNEDDFESVSIGSDVWIGANVLIFGGIKIGHGAVIGAGAVVTKDVPPYAVVLGVPAKILKYRFESEVIEQLLASEWWKQPHDIVIKNRSSFNNIPSFITGIKS